MRAHPARSAAARTGLAVVGAGLAGHLVPSVATIPALRNRYLPRLSGRSDGTHVALTFDDGPDPVATGLFLDELARLRVRATFFLLGSMLEAHPDLGRRIADEGHELALHGWTHRPHLLRTPWAVRNDLARGYAAIVRHAGRTPLFWRPPNGILSGAGLTAATHRGLRPVLWTADGRDWQARATPQTVLARLTGQLSAGGTVLLHDSDITSAPQAWRSALGALAGLVELCAHRGWPVGPLRDHWDHQRPTGRHRRWRQGQ